MKTSVTRWRRHGVTMVFTLGVLTVLLALALLVTRSFVTLHHERRWHERRAQADYLLQAGLERAVVRFAASPEYRGEVWRIESTPEGLSRAADVTISILAADTKPRVKVAVAYAQGNQQVSAVEEWPLPATPVAP